MNRPVGGPCVQAEEHGRCGPLGGRGLETKLAIELEGVVDGRLALLDLFAALDSRLDA